MQNRDFLTHNKISLGVSDRLPWVKIGSFATVRELARIPLHSALSQRERPKWNSSKGRLFNEKLDALVIVNRNFYIYYPNDIDPSPLTFSQTKKYLVLSSILSNSYVQNKSCKYFLFFYFPFFYFWTPTGKMRRIRKTEKYEFLARQVLGISFIQFVQESFY